ncbi:hypothetical protein [Streptosporangium sp. NPDC048865]
MHTIEPTCDDMPDSAVRAAWDQPQPKTRGLGQGAQAVGLDARLLEFGRI